MTELDKHNNNILERDFFRQDCLDLAPALLGKLLVRRLPDGRELRLRICETEAYRGENDSACHARAGRTPRTEVMYQAGGVFYVYLCYGAHHLINVVSGAEGEPQAVLLRSALESPGPGRLSRALEVDRQFNQLPITPESQLWLEDDGFPVAYSAHPRIGISYASEHDQQLPWRFVLQLEIDDDLFDSKIENTTLIDGYMIPDAQVEQYLREREEYRQKVKAIFSRTCAEVGVDFAGSQDGEAVVGYDAQGDLVRIFHLDPQGLRELKLAERRGELAEYVDACS